MLAISPNNRTAQGRRNAISIEKGEREAEALMTAGRWVDAAAAYKNTLTRSKQQRLARTISACVEGKINGGALHRRIAGHAARVIGHGSACVCRCGVCAAGLQSARNRSAASLLDETQNVQCAKLI